MKAVNMKNYRFGQQANHQYIGFGILDEATNTFASFDGKNPYVLPIKKTIQSCIDAGWADSLKRVGYTA